MRPLIPYDMQLLAGTILTVLLLLQLLYWLITGR
jgi:hypothetical protein